MIKFLVRWAFRFFVLAVVLGVALVLLKDALVKSVIEARIRTQTGMDVKLGRVDVGLLSPSLTMENARLYNAPEFGGAPLLDIPELHLVYNPGALLLRRLHLRLLRLSIAEVGIVEGKNGLTNLTLALDELALAPTSPTAAEPSSVLGLEFAGIDTLNLTFDKITYRSLRHPGRAAEVKVGLKNEIVTGIKSMAELRPILARAFVRNGITISPGAGSNRPPPGRAAPANRPKAR